MPRQIQLSPSRIVEGNVYKSSNIGMNGQILAKPKFYFGVAIAKNDPRLGEIWGAYQGEALASYANNQGILQRIQRGLIPNSGFAWKIADGDAPDRREKPGQANCWIFKFTTTWDIKVVDQHNQPINPTLLRTGFYCDVLANLAGNGKTDHTAGLYANPVFVRWLFPGYGEEIQPGPQADKVMGAAPTQLPPGATPSPQGGMGGGAGSPPAAQAHHIQHQTPASPAYEAPPGFGGHPASGGQGAVNPTQSGGHMNNGLQPGYAQTAGSPMSPTNTPGPMTTASPSNSSHPQSGVAGGPAAMGAAMPAGAHYTPAQPGSPTASHGSVPGFAHGNPSGQ